LVFLGLLLVAKVVEKVFWFCVWLLKSGVEYKASLDKFAACSVLFSENAEKFK
jgi:hypothetical protein